MLSPTARKFAEALNIQFITDAAGEHLPAGYEIWYGDYSSRIENGVKVQDARLYHYGKFVAQYYAESDEVRQ